MTLRQKLACVGLTVFGLQIASAAAGGAPLADRLRLWLDPEQLLAAFVLLCGVAAAGLKLYTDYTNSHFQVTFYRVTSSHLGCGERLLM